MFTEQVYFRQVAKATRNCANVRACFLLAAVDDECYMRHLRAKIRTFAESLVPDWIRERSCERWVGAMFMECVDNKQIPSALVGLFPLKSSYCIE